MSSGVAPWPCGMAAHCASNWAWVCLALASVGLLVLALAVGCDGRVRRSSVQRDDTGDAGFASCVAETFRYAPFPAHARDEVELLVPLRFTAP